MHAVLIAMLLAQKRQLRDLGDRVETLEARLDDGESHADDDFVGGDAVDADDAV